MDSSEGILLEVTVPENAAPLSTITVQAPDGRFFEIVLPDKVEPGNVISVMIPAPKLPEFTSETKTAQFDFDHQDIAQENVVTKKEGMSKTKAAAITAVYFAICFRFDHI
jgi:hypothetical protein